MSWQRVPFESLYAIPSKNGLTRPGRVRGNGCKMINMGELFAYDRIGAIDMELVPMNERELENMLVGEGDLLFARQSLVLSGAGKCSLVINVPEPTTFESHIIRVRLKTELTNPAFYFYYFKSPICSIRSIVTQGVQAGIRGNELKTLLVHLPPIDVQDKIVEVLSNYDDLIENNRRRMALLEDSARLLYNEWFVRLRFPGYEHTRIVDGVPEGWKKQSISNIADCVGGGTPSTKVLSYWENGDITWVTPTDVTRNSHLILLDSEKKISAEGLKSSSAKIVPSHAVLMTSRASVGFFAVAGREVCTNQGFISIVPNDPIHSAFLLFQLSERVEEIRAMGSGATYPEVSRGKFREFHVTIPTKRIVADFDEQATVLLKQIRILKQQNQKLRTARDMLLPRLMSREIAV